MKIKHMKIYGNQGSAEREICNTKFLHQKRGNPNSHLKKLGKQELQI